VIDHLAPVILFPLKTRSISHRITAVCCCVLAVAAELELAFAFLLFSFSCTLFHCECGRGSVLPRIHMLMVLNQYRLPIEAYILYAAIANQLLLIVAYKP
jgi:hypothetical protein